MREVQLPDGAAPVWYPAGGEGVPGVIDFQVPEKQSTPTEARQFN